MENYSNQYINADLPTEAQIDPITDQVIEKFIEEEEVSEDHSTALRKRFMRNSREPIHELPSIFDDLNECFKKVILDHMQEILSLEFYQEQMYYVLDLTNGKRQSDIAVFFNV